MYHLTKSQFDKLYSNVNSIHGLLTLLKYYSPKLDIVEISCTIPVIELAWDKAEDLICDFLEIEDNKIIN